MGPVDETVTYLEMTSPEQLVPGSPPSEPVVMEEVGPTSVTLVSATYARIGEPYDWTSRAEWSGERWREHLSRAEVLTWLARVEGEVAGMVELELQPDGQVEIPVFGLLPEFVAKGLGGQLLTLGTRFAWEARAPGWGPARRVWLHTSSLDHAHARRNYERRGFRAFRFEHVPRPDLTP